MSYQSEQDAFVKRCNIKVGSRVKIMRKADSYERGWGVCWVSNMDANVGAEGVVTEIHNGVSGIRVRARVNGVCDGFNYPFFVLKRVL